MSDFTPSFRVLSGCAAVRSGRYWVGVIEGNIYCPCRRLTAEKALHDAHALLTQPVKDD